MGMDKYVMSYSLVLHKRSTLLLFSRLFLALSKWTNRQECTFLSQSMLATLWSHFRLTALVGKTKVCPPTTNPSFINGLHINPGQSSVLNFQVNWFFW